VRLCGEWLQNTNGEEMAAEAITPMDVKDYKPYLLRVKRFRPGIVDPMSASFSAFSERGTMRDLIEAKPGGALGHLQDVELAARWLTKKACSTRRITCLAAFLASR